MTDITKEYLNTIWKKRKLNKKGQKKIAETQNTENLETRKHGDHNEQSHIASPTGIANYYKA